VFRLKENGTNVKTEIFAGIATFLTMAYIVFVNPSILVQAVGVDASSPLYQQFFGAFMVATILGSATATLVMAFFANYPFALAPGMGLNAYFTYTVCLGMGIDWRVALAAVFVEGLIFIGLTLVGFRKFVAGIIPESIKVAISAGIGFFIAFIGLRSAGIVVSNPATSVALGDLTNPGVFVTVVGLLVIVALYHRKIPGAVMIGILVATLVGAIPGIGVTKYQGIVGPVPDISPTFMKLDFSGFLSLDFWIVVLTFFFVDFFDTLGTITGLAQSAGFMKNGELPRANRAFLADAIGTSVGALFGTSTVTTYIESGAGIAEGGRTGLTALVVALCMLAMLFFAPLAQTVPGIRDRSRSDLRWCAHDRKPWKSEMGRHHRSAPCVHHRYNYATHILHSQWNSARYHFLCTGEVLLREIERSTLVHVDSRSRLRFVAALHKALICSIVL